MLSFSHAYYISWDFVCKADKCDILHLFSIQAL